MTDAQSELFDELGGTDRFFHDLLSFEVYFIFLQVFHRFFLRDFLMDSPFWRIGAFSELHPTTEIVPKTQNRASLMTSSWLRFLRSRKTV